jgi:hypothetical protein
MRAGLHIEPRHASKTLCSAMKKEPASARNFRAALAPSFVRKPDCSVPEALANYSVLGPAIWRVSLVPAVSLQFSEFTYAGGLMAYQPNMEDLQRHVPAYVDCILKGCQPADVPV